jgi:hypothetical protein
MICRFLVALAFHAAGGEGWSGGSGECEARLRGERRGEGGDVGIGDRWAGEESPVRSSESISGDGGFEKLS